MYVKRASYATLRAALSRRSVEWGWRLQPETSSPPHFTTVGTSVHAMADCAALRHCRQLASSEGPKPSTVSSAAPAPARRAGRSWLACCRSLPRSTRAPTFCPATAATQQATPPRQQQHTKAGSAATIRKEQRRGRGHGRPQPRPGRQRWQRHRAATHLRPLRSAGWPTWA